MQCPFCHYDMTSIDSGRPLPQLSMIWVCKQCPNEVRIIAEKDVETEQHWLIKHMSIFVKNGDKQFCLHWDYFRKYFDICDTNKTHGPDSYIFRTQVMPTTITPSNALDKLKIYILFL